MQAFILEEAKPPDLLITPAKAFILGSTEHYLCVGYVDSEGASYMKQLLFTSYSGDELRVLLLLREQVTAYYEALPEPISQNAVAATAALPIFSKPSVRAFTTSAPVRLFSSTRPLAEPFEMSNLTNHPLLTTATKQIAATPVSRPPAYTLSAMISR